MNAKELIKLFPRIESLHLLRVHFNSKASISWASFFDLLISMLRKCTEKICRKNVTNFPDKSVMIFFCFTLYLFRLQKFDQIGLYKLLTRVAVIFYTHHILYRKISFFSQKLTRWFFKPAFVSKFHVTFWTIQKRFI